MNNSADFIENCSVFMPHGKCVSVALEARELISGGSSELALQKLIERNPFLLSQQFAHCHHVAANVSFGGKLVADFMCLDWPSHWPHWVAVEIEAPNKAVMTKSGRRSAMLEHALQQVRDWREFVKNNMDFVNRSKVRNGLGLEHADSNMIGHVYIGRRFADPSLAKKWNVLRDQIAASDNIYVHSWDGFVEHALKRAYLFDSTVAGIVIDLGDGNPITLTPHSGI